MYIYKKNSYKKEKEDKEFEHKKGLDSLVHTPSGEFITVNDDVTITLTNNLILSGVLAYVGPSSIIVRISDYEYEDTGVHYQQSLVLIKDIKEIHSSGKSKDEIDWQMYYEAMHAGYD